MIVITIILSQKLMLYIGLNFASITLRGIMYNGTFSVCTLTCLRLHNGLFEIIWNPLYNGHKLGTNRYCHTNSVFNSVRYEQPLHKGQRFYSQNVHYLDVSLYNTK